MTNSAQLRCTDPAFAGMHPLPELEALVDIVRRPAGRVNAPQPSVRQWVRHPSDCLVLVVEVCRLLM